MLLGYQAVYDADWFDALEFAKAAGFGFVSFDLNVPRFYIDQLSKAEIVNIRSHAGRLGVGIAFHAPGDNISLFTDYPAIRKGILEHFTAIISAAEEMNALHVTVHPGNYPSFKQANRTEDDFIAQHVDYFSEVLYENLSFLAAQTRTVKLCVENYGFTPLTMGVVDRLLGSHENIFLTWDIAKTYDKTAQLIPAVADFMWSHQNRISELHVHDIVKGFHSHQIIGEGDIDFEGYKQLFELPNLAVTIEVRPREAAVKSRDNLLRMLADA